MKLITACFSVNLVNDAKTVFVQDWHASLEMTCIEDKVAEINSQHT